MTMNYAEMTTDQLGRFIEEEALKAGITEPNAQIRYMAEKDEALIKEFMNRIMQVGPAPEVHI